MTARAPRLELGWLGVVAWHWGVVLGATGTVVGCHGWVLGVRGAGVEAAVGFVRASSGERPGPWALRASSLCPGRDLAEAIGADSPYPL